MPTIAGLWFFGIFPHNRVIQTKGHRHKAAEKDDSKHSKDN
jgi:hypothetical protein